MQFVVMRAWTKPRVLDLHFVLCTLSGPNQLESHQTDLVVFFVFFSQHNFAFKCKVYIDLQLCQKVLNVVKFGSS